MANYTAKYTGQDVRLNTGAICKFTQGSGALLAAYPNAVYLDAFAKNGDPNAGVSYCLIYAALRQAIKNGRGANDCVVPNVHGPLHKALQNMGFTPVAGSWRYDATAKRIPFDAARLAHQPPAAVDRANAADYRHASVNSAHGAANEQLMAAGHAFVDEGGNRCCYLSTAACEEMGLADDCEELQALRWFRDHVMLSSEQGRQEVAAYYRNAPACLAVIQASPQVHSILRDLYSEVIQPAAQLIRDGQHPQAYALYAAMVRRLGAC